MTESAEHFFIPTPVKYERVAPDGTHYEMYYYEKDGDAIDVKWSSKLPLPAVGDRVYMAINQIGYGEVKAYADCHGWLGILVKPEDPPEWWVKQNQNVLDGLCCVFGMEVRKEK